MEPKVAETTPPRVPLDVDVECKTQGLASSTFQSMNLSEGGIFIKSPFPLEPASPVCCSFRLPDSGPPVNVTGEIAWTRTGPPEQIPPPGMGIRFDALDETTAVRIRKHVALMERDLLWEEHQEIPAEDDFPATVENELNEDFPVQDSKNHAALNGENAEEKKPGNLILEGDLLFVTDANGRKYTARVKSLTSEGITLEMPIVKNAQEPIPDYNEHFADIFNPAAKLSELPVFQELSPPAGLSVSPPPPPDAASHQGPYMEPDCPAPVMREDTFSSSTQPLPPDEPAREEIDLYEEIQRSKPSYKKEAVSFEDPVSMEDSGLSPSLPKRGWRHSGIVDFKGRVSKDPLRRSRSQKKTGAGKTLFLCALALTALGSAAAFYFWKPAEKESIKTNKTHQKPEKSITLDPHAVELPSPDKGLKNVPASSASNPENTRVDEDEGETAESRHPAKTNSSAPSPGKEAAREPGKTPNISMEGGRNRLTLATNKKPDKITHYWMADPPGIVVDLHGVQPRLKPGRYELEKNGARLLRVTGNENRTRFIVYFHATVPRDRVDVKKDEGGGSVTWLQRSGGRRLSQRNSLKRGKNPQSSQEKITLAE